MFLNTILTYVSLVILVWTVAYQFSSKARFYTKVTCLYVFFVVNSVQTCVARIWKYGDFYGNAIYAGKRVDWFSRILGVQWQVECEDKEAIDPKQSYIVLCNHQSSLDVLAMMKVWPTLGPTVAMAKDELKWTGPFGLSLALCGTIFIKRMSSEQGRQALAQAGNFAKANGTSIWVFPEGTRNRNRDGSMLTFKKGAFHMALDFGMPILPVVVSQYDFLSHSEKIFDTGDVKIKVLKPIPTESYNKETLNDLIALTRDRMIDELKTISHNNNKKDN